jgi:hypothetical protein
MHIGSQDYNRGVRQRQRQRQTERREMIGKGGRREDGGGFYI